MLVRVPYSPRLAAGRNMAYYAMELGSDEDFGSEDGDFEPAAESDEEMEEMEEENYPEPLLPRQRRQRERARRERARIPSASSCLGRAGPGMRRICRIFLYSSRPLA